MMVLHSLGEKTMDQPHLLHVMNCSWVHTDPRGDLHDTTPAAVHGQLHLVMFLQEYEAENNL